MPDIRQIIRDEMRQQVLNRNRNNQRYRNPRHFGRRTQTGVVTCGFCGKRGHAQCYCRRNNSPENQNQGRNNRQRNHNRTPNSQNQNNTNRFSNQPFQTHSHQHNDNPQEN